MPFLFHDWRVAEALWRLWQHTKHTEDRLAGGIAKVLQLCRRSSYRHDDKHISIPDDEAILPLYRRKDKLKH